jgi:hypothetical protein
MGEVIMKIYYKCHYETVQDGVSRFFTDVLCIEDFVFTEEAKELIYFELLCQYKPRGIELNGENFFLKEMNELQYRKWLKSRPAHEKYSESILKQGGEF